MSICVHFIGSLELKCIFSKKTKINCQVHLTFYTNGKELKNFLL